MHLGRRGGLTGLRKSRQADLKSASTESGEAVGRGNQEATLTRSTVWLMLGKSAAFAFNFALPLVLVRRLDQSAFGMYKQVFLVVTTAMALLPLGFGQSACYFLPRADERPQQIVLNILLFHLVVAGAGALLLVLQPNLLATIFNNPELVGYGPLVGLALLLWVVGSLLETFAAANREFRLASGFILAESAAAASARSSIPARLMTSSSLSST